PVPADNGLLRRSLGSFSGHVAAAASPRTVVLGEVYSPGWQATVGVQDLQHAPVFGWANGFTVPAGVSGTLRIGYSGEWIRIVWVIVGGVLVIVLIMGGSWALDGIVPSKTAGTPVAAGTPVTASATTAPLSEAWYCPAPSAQGLGSTVWTANLGTGPVHLRRSGTGASGATAEADLGAGTFGGLPAAPSAANVPVSVEAFGGATGSHVSVLAPSVGGATGRCSRQPGTRWIFPIASTAPGYDTYLLVTNPFLEEAVVTVRVLTDNGDQIPSGLSHVQIPQRS